MSSPRARSAAKASASGRIIPRLQPAGTAAAAAAAAAAASKQAESVAGMCVLLERENRENNSPNACTPPPPSARSVATPSPTPPIVPPKSATTTVAAATANVTSAARKTPSPVSSSVAVVASAASATAAARSVSPREVPLPLSPSSSSRSTPSPSSPPAVPSAPSPSILPSLLPRSPTPSHPEPSPTPPPLPPSTTPSSAAAAAAAKPKLSAAAVAFVPRGIASPEVSVPSRTLPQAPGKKTASPLPPATANVIDTFWSHGKCMLCMQEVDAPSILVHVAGVHPEQWNNVPDVHIELLVNGIPVVAPNNAPPIPGGAPPLLELELVLGLPRRVTLLVGQRHSSTGAAAFAAAAVSSSAMVLRDIQMQPASFLHDCVHLNLSLNSPVSILAGAPYESSSSFACASEPALVGVHACALALRVDAGGRDAWIVRGMLVRIRAPHISQFTPTGPMLRAPPSLLSQQMMALMSSPVSPPARFFPPAPAAAASATIAAATAVPHWTSAAGAAIPAGATVPHWWNDALQSPAARQQLLLSQSRLYGQQHPVRSVGVTGGAPQPVPPPALPLPPQASSSSSMAAMPSEPCPIMPPVPPSSGVGVNSTTSNVGVAGGSAAGEGDSKKENNNSAAAPVPAAPGVTEPTPIAGSASSAMLSSGAPETETEQLPRQPTKRRLSKTQARQHFQDTSAAAAAAAILPVAGARNKAEEDANVSSLPTRFAAVLRAAEASFHGSWSEHVDPFFGSVLRWRGAQVLVEANPGAVQPAPSPMWPLWWRCDDKEK